MTLDLHALANLPGFGSARRRLILAGDLIDASATCRVGEHEIRGSDIPAILALRRCGPASSREFAEAMSERDDTARDRNRRRLEALVRLKFAERVETKVGAEESGAVRVAYQIAPSLAAALDQEAAR